MFNDNKRQTLLLDHWDIQRQKKKEKKRNRRKGKKRASDSSSKSGKDADTYARTVTLRHVEGGERNDRVRSLGVITNG